MAPRKRSRDVRDVDGGEVEVGSASPGFRTNDQHTKRARVALGQAGGGSTASGDEPSSSSDAPDVDQFLNSDTNDIHADGSSDDGSRDGSRPARERELEHPMRQHSSDDEREEDLNEGDELAQTQFVHGERKQHRENIAAEHGIVEEIYCTNFMCHAKLRMRLGPLINFIIGHNGSGKSAVLTALQICLGTKASETSRGKGLKSLVKEGTEKATVGVVLKNEGESAYKPETYGRTITVERHFSRSSGSSGFRLKSASNAVISTKKADLDDLLDYFSLQMDNPINVLTQDKARAFLSNSTATEKYRFFMKGTQLEVLHGDYKILEENLDSANAKLQHKEEDIKMLKRRLDEAEHRKQRADNTRKMHERIQRTNAELAWSQIGDQEHELEQKEQKVATCKEELTEAEGLAETAAAAFESQDQALEAQNRAIAEHKNALEPLRQTQSSAKEKWEASRQALLQLKVEERTIHENFKKAKRDIAEAERQIAIETERLEGEGGEAHIQRLRELDELKKEAAEAKQAMRDHDGQLPDLHSGAEAAKQRWNDAKEPIPGLRGELNQLKNGLNRLQNDQGQIWNAYGGLKMENLCRAIDRESRWRKKPVGPMGSHVQIVKPQWGSIVETVLGANLNAFVVTCKYDHDILEQQTNRIGIKVPTFITTDSPIDTDHGEPDPDVDTIMRILRIEEHSVRNTLIINNMIDQTVLFEKLDDGRNFMYGGGSRPRNTCATITMNPSDKAKGSRWDYNKAGAEKVNPVKPWQGPSRMKTDKKEEIRLLQERVDAAQRSLSQAEQRVNELQRAMNKAGQLVVAYKREQARLKEVWQKADDRAEAKQSEIDANRPKDGRLQELQHQLEEAKQEKKSAEDAMTDAEASRDSLNTKARELKDDLDHATLEVASVDKLVEKATRKKADVEEARFDALEKKNEAFHAVDWFKEKLAQYERKVVEQKDLIAEWIPKAQVVSRERVRVTASTKELSDRVDRLTAQWNRDLATQQGTAEEVTQQYSDAYNAYKKASKENKEMKELTRLLLRTLAERQRRWGLFRGHISMRTRINFSYLLTERNFRGRLTFDHAEKTLDLNIEPDITKQSDAGRQTKTLSGGEKSFSTICLLLSIWEAMGSPIRCLDEFDVFMDSVNRAQSMKLMIETARRSVGRQFILITPQSMHSVDIHDDVTIHKMSDPERGREPGQQPLNFGPASAS